MKEYTHAVLARAGELQRLEAAARLMPAPRREWRGALAAALAALMALIPSVSAAQMIL